MKSFALSLLLFSTFFWLWAVKNTVGMEASQYDLGILSFATVMLTSSYLLGLANHQLLPSKLTKTLASTSHGLVALNYALGCYLGYAALGRPGFGLYCGIFTVLWVGIGFWGAKAMDAEGRGSASIGETERLSS